MEYIIVGIIGIFFGFTLGVFISSNKNQDLRIENNLLSKQIEKYKKHEEYRKLDIKVLDDDIELDKLMEDLQDEENNN